MKKTITGDLFDSDKTEQNQLSAQKIALDRFQSLLLLRDERSVDLIADFCNGYACGWKMAVCESFSNALDIKPAITQDACGNSSTSSNISAPLMQGNLFSFAEGDTIYDISATQVWSEVIKKLGICFQIRKAKPVSPQIKITRIMKNPKFNKVLIGERRNEVFENMPNEYTLLKIAKENVKKLTGKYFNDDLLTKLWEIGAVLKQEEITERSPGVVEYDVLGPNKERTKLEFKEHRNATQDEFIRTLIAGNI